MNLQLLIYCESFEMGRKPNQTCVKGVWNLISRGIWSVQSNGGSKATMHLSGKNILIYPRFNSRLSPFFILERSDHLRKATTDGDAVAAGKLSGSTQKELFIESSSASIDFFSTSFAIYPPLNPLFSGTKDCLFLKYSDAYQPRIKIVKIKFLNLLKQKKNTF